MAKRAPVQLSLGLDAPPVQKSLHVFPSVTAARRHCTEKGSLVLDFAGLRAACVQPAQIDMERWSKLWLEGALNWAFSRTPSADSNGLEHAGLGQVVRLWPWLRSDRQAAKRCLRGMMEFRRAGVLASDLASIESDDARAWGILLAAYDDALSAAGLVDMASAEREAIYALTQGTLPTAVSGIDHVHVYGAAFLDTALTDLLQALTLHGIVVNFHVGWDRAQGHDFSYAEGFLRRIEARAHGHVKLCCDDLQGQGPLATLRAAPLQEHAWQGLGSAFTLCAAHSVALEADAVWRQILTCIHSGVPPKAIALLTVAPRLHQGAWLSRIQRLAKRSDVALDIAPGVATPLPLPARAWLRFLAGDQDPLALCDALDAMGAELLPDASGVSSATASRLLTLLGSAPGQGGALSERFDNLCTKTRTGVGREQAVALGQALDALMMQTQSWPRQGTAAEMFSWPQKVLDSLWLGTSSGPPATLAAACAQLEGSGNELAKAFGERTFSREAVLNILRDILVTYAERKGQGSGSLAGDAANAGVFVGTLDDIVATTFSHVFVMSAEAANFPHGFYDEDLLDDGLRAAVNQQLGPRMRLLAASDDVSGEGSAAMDARARYLWRHLLAAAEKSLHLSFVAGADEAQSEPTPFVEPGLAADGGIEICHAHPGYASASPLQPLVAIAHGGQVGEGASVPIRITPVRPAGELAALVAIEQKTDLRRFESFARRLGLVQQRPARYPRLQTQQDHVLPQVGAMVHSVSKLDTLALCRYRYFAQTVLGLRADEHGGVGLNPRQEGSAIHAALELALEDFVGDGGLTSARQDPDHALQAIYEKLKRSQRQIFSEAMVHPRLQRGLFDRIWRLVRMRLREDFAPEASADILAVEYPFDDRPSKDPDRAQGQVMAIDALCFPGSDSEDTGLTLKVRGSIDRVDRERDGTLRVLDYKRSAKQRPPGRHLQLPLYAWVASRDFDGPTETEAAAVASGWVGLRDAKTVRPRPWGESAKEQRQHVRDVVGERLGAVAMGAIDRDPPNMQTCERCDFARLCDVRLKVQDDGDGWS